MNDFTKDELAVLKHVLNINADGYKDPALLNKIQSLIDNYGTIKISRRKCPICDSDFNDAQLTNDKKFIYECSNEQCSYFHGFGV